MAAALQNVTIPQPAHDADWPAAGDLGAACSPERFFELSLDLLLIASTNGYIKRANPAFQRILGWSEAELTSHSFFRFVHPDDIAKTQRQMLKLAAGSPVEAFENRLITKDQQLRDFLWTAYPGREHGLFYAVGHEIGQRKALEVALRERSKALERANRRLAVLATTDPLTGLLNRRAFMDRVHSVGQNASRLGLLLIDIDHFKQFNDRHGHSHGDEVLCLAANLLAQCVPDVLARLGGEEFAALLPDPWLRAGRAVARRALERFRQFPWPTDQVTVSIGMAVSYVAPDHGIDQLWAELASRADRALYRAKHTGRNRFCVAAGEDVAAI